MVLEEAWQSVENHDQSIENMTKGRHEESSLLFLERLQNNPCQKQDLWHEHGITFWILKQPWSSSTHWNFWLKCITDKWEFRQIWDVLKQFTIFEAFWPLCRPAKEGNQSLLVLSTNQWKQHRKDNHQKDVVENGNHDHGKWHIYYRIHNKKLVEILEVFLGWETLRDYNG